MRRCDCCGRVRMVLPENKSLSCRPCQWWMTLMEENNKSMADFLAASIQAEANAARITGVGAYLV